MAWSNTQNIKSYQIYTYTINLCTHMGTNTLEGNIAQYLWYI
jgi:hypothetical protein